MICHRTFIGTVALAIAALGTGCATDPEVLAERAAVEGDIDEILSLAPVGEAERCLSERRFRSYQALSDKYLLFQGPGDKQWINELRGRCHDLRYADVLVMRRFSGSQMCEHDRFEVADWFAWPWYRRWPWDWGTWGSGEICHLGKFHPVTEQQAEEIRSLLDR